MKHIARAALAAFLAFTVAIAPWGEALAQNPPPERPPGGFAVGGINGAATTAAATAGAATLNGLGGKITSEALTTAAAAIYTLTLTNSQVLSTDRVMVSVANGTNTGGVPAVARVQPANGSVVIVIQNIGATVFNGTIVVSFLAFKA